jgi:multiple sugar transport system permease protein
MTQITPQVQKYRPSGEPGPAFTSLRKLGGRLLVWIPLLIGAVLMMAPFFWLISSSLKTPSQLWLYPPRWIPDPVRWENFPDALTVLPFGRYTLNTLTITMPVLVGVVLTSSLGGYGFARLNFPGKNLFFMIFLATMMLPSIVTMIPIFVLFSKIGWVNTFKPLIIPPIMGGGAFNVFLFRQFFRTIPEELSSAAKIDGCNEFDIYWRIIMPLAKPAITTVAIFTFLSTWNDFMGPLIYLNSDSLKTIALGLAGFQGLYSTHWELLMAASLVMTIPPLVLFFAAQQYFVEGIVMTGM